MTVMPDRYRDTPEYDLVSERMIEAARSPEQVVYYRPHIARLIGIADDEAGDHIPQLLGQVCGEISEDEHLAGRPMLSAVAINRGGGPGLGFFDLARLLGFQFADDDAFWIREHRRAVEYWTTH